MQALDPRLLRRARPARVLLAVDAALGVGAALLVLCQALLLAWIVARSFDGASLSRFERGLILLVAVFAGRALLAWDSRSPAGAARRRSSRNSGSISCRSGCASNLRRSTARRAARSRRSQSPASVRSRLSDAPVLVLDEPTAHLDAATAERLMNDVLDAAGNRTVLLITHRSEGLARMDDVSLLPARL